MTDVNKIQTVYGQSVAVKVIRNLNNSRIVESVDVNIYPIIMGDFKKASEAYEADDIIAFIKLCAPFAGDETLNNLDPVSVLDLYDKCKELNKDGFFRFFARQEEKKQARIAKNLKLLEQAGISEAQRVQMITELAKTEMPGNV